MFLALCVFSFQVRLGALRYTSDFENSKKSVRPYVSCFRFRLPPYGPSFQLTNISYYELLAIRIIPVTYYPGYEDLAIRMVQCTNSYLCVLFYIQIVSDADIFVFQ